MPDMPHNLEAEQAVLGAMLTNPDVISMVRASGLPADAFYRRGDSIIYSTLEEMHEAGLPIDLLTFTSELESRNLLEKIGGREYIVTLLNSCPCNGVDTASYYLELVRSAAVRRRLIEFGQKCVALATDSPDAETAVASAESLLAQVSVGDSIDYPCIADSLAAVLDTATDSSPADILYTGIRALDDKMRGIPPRSLVVMGGDASAGKTAMAMQWSLEWARQGHRVGWISIEMDGESLARRIIVEQQGIPMNKIWNKSLSDLEVQMMARMINDPMYREIVVDSRSDVSDANVVSRVRDMHARTGAAIIVIDHLHLIQIRGKAENSVRLGVDSIVSSLKKLKKDLGVRIVLLAQLSRQGQFKESQGVDAGGDINIKLQRPVLGSPEVTCQIAKQRDGATGTLSLWFAPYGFYSSEYEMESAMRLKSFTNNSE